MWEAIRKMFLVFWRPIRSSRTYMIMMRPFLIFLITLYSIVSRQRMSHENGLVARGTVRFYNELDVPDNAFFKPGKEYKCSLRHASVSFLDDAALVVRAGSLKFSHDPINSPFDMLMNNGVATPFWNMHTFWQFMQARRKGGRSHLIDYFTKNPRCYFNVRNALRFNPNSFANLEYYSQTPLEFIATDGKVRYAKFRLIPRNPPPSSDGVPTEERLQAPWFQQADSHETRSRNYLKEEYRERLLTANVHYHFQIQLLDWCPLYERSIELNSLYPWDEHRHPWRNLAEVIMVDALDYKEGNQFVYSLNHLPPCLRLIPALGIHDGPSIDYLRAGGTWPRRARLWVYKLFGQRRPIPDKRRRTAAQNADCTTSVVTSDDIYMRPVLPQNDSKAGLFKRQNHLERAQGIYQYIHGYITTEASTKTPNWPPSYWYQRVFQVYEADPSTRSTVQMPLPPFVRELSNKEAYSDYVQGRLYKIITASVLSTLFSSAEEKIRRLKGLQVYRYMYFGKRKKPRSIERWQEDAYFAQQRLTGVNPMVITLFKQVPENFPITDKLLDGLMDVGESIESAIQQSRLYVCDYAILEGISCRKECYLTHPIALFYVGSSRQLMPIAIQLYQSPDKGPIFTPNDDPGLWRAVKAFVQSADAQIHEVVEHLLHGHLVAEVFDLAMHRTLPSTHPVHKLLMPHFEFTMAVNHSARTKMLAPGGPIDRTMAVGAKGAFELMGKAWWQQWDFARHNVKNDINARGIGDTTALPNYHWRDDALKIWGIVERYVQSMVEHFYENDQAVVDDNEIQAFHKEVRGKKGGNIRKMGDSIREMPGKDNGFTDRATLIEVLTRLIYTTSAGHAAVNNGQYDYYGFIPNVPGALYRRPPQKKSETWDDSDFLKALPSFKASSVQILMVRLLSRRTEMPIGTFPTGFFAGTDAVWPIVDQFRRDLKVLSLEIQHRNSQLDEPYTYLDPAQIACSITA